MFVENCITLHMKTESQFIYPQRSKVTVTVILEVKHSRIPWADPGHFPWVRGFKNRDKISLNKVDVLLHLYIIIHFTDLSHNYISSTIYRVHVNIITDSIHWHA